MRTPLLPLTPAILPPALPHALALALLAACTPDYNLNGEKDPDGADDTAPDSEAPDSGTTVVDACEQSSAEVISVALNDACQVPPAQGGFTPEVEWNLSGYQGYGPPAVAQLDDDNGDGVVDAGDIPDIVYVANTGQGIICVDGRSGRIKWTSTAATDITSAVAIGDVDADGDMEIVASNGPSQIVLLDHLGNALWTTYVDNGPLNTFLYPSIADLDADGQPEIIAGRNILNAGGRVLGTGALGVGCVENENYGYYEGSVAVAADMNGDGQLEVVVGNAAYRKDGSLLMQSNYLDGLPAIADMDLDGEPEIVAVKGNRVFTLESDMSWTGWEDTFPNTNYIGPPAIDDLDGDGRPDFVVVGSSQMRAYRWNGTRLWTQQVQDQSGAAGPILFDFEQDGYPEVVYADEEWVRVFDGRDGHIKLESGDHESYTGFETPIVADVDADGHVEIIMLHGQSAAGLTVYGDANNTWPPGRQIWNQHGYSITNVNPDGTIPAVRDENWTLYNNFRSADAGAPPASWKDVTVEVVDVCTDECPDHLYMVVRVWNQGTEEVPAGLPISVRAGPNGAIVATVTLPDAIPSGYSSPGIQLDVNGADLAGERPWIEADRDAGGFDALMECDEENNGVTAEAQCR